MQLRWSTTPDGARDILFQDCADRRGLLDALGQLFLRAGFGEIQTPLFEFYDLFVQTGFPLPQEAMVKLVDRGGSLIVCRPDSTTPVARVAATRLTQRPLRLFYLQPVFRADDAHTGRCSQTLQAGVEWIGTAGVDADAEMIALAFSALETAGVMDSRVELGHAGLFGEFCARLALPRPLAVELRLLIERRRFAALGDALEALCPPADARALTKLLALYGGPETLSEAEALLGAASPALSELHVLSESLAQRGYRVAIDFGLVGSIDYYTGVLFRGYAPGAADAVLTGGRYDKLMSCFGQDAPAVGFALDLDAILGREGAAS